MEVNIGGYPKVHTDYLSTKNDLDRLHHLLDQTKIQYRNALNKAQHIPFGKRVSRFLVSLFSLGLVRPSDSKIEIEKETVKIHRNFCPLIEKINIELSQVSEDLSFLEELDHQYTITLGAGFRFNGYPSNWEELSRSVRERDGYRCSYCGSSNLGLHTHHVIPLSRGGSNAMSNLMTLCEKCHSAKHPHMRR
jgi:hypothetical protein